MDYDACPCYSATKLFRNKELMFDGILFFLGKGKLEPREFSIIAAYIDASFPPSNCLSNDFRLRYYTNKIERQDQFIAFEFHNIKVRPSAICLRSFREAKNENTLRSFVIVGREILTSPPVILGEFNYTNELKNGGAGIFPINTHMYFGIIYLQETGRTFGYKWSLSIERMEIHGLIRKV